MSKVKAVAAAIVFMLGASVSYAQTLTAPPSSQLPGGQAELASGGVNPGVGPLAGSSSIGGYRVPNEPGLMYVACWAKVPSHNTAYFSATFAAPSVYNARKEFRKLVTTHYGPVSKLQCAGKFSETVVNEQVEKWKDSAHTQNTIVDTDWQPVAALSRTLPSAQAKN